MQLNTTTPDERSVIYEDVRSLISPGFLVHHVDVNGTRLVLRSLSEDDWFVLRTRTWGAPVREWKAWLVSTAVWMVDGQIVMGEDDVAYRIFEMALRLPDSVLDDLDMLVTALMKRVQEGALLVEGFMYEDESRMLWKSQGTAQSYTYFQGRRIQNNPVRRIWTYYNEIEDQRLHNEYLWSMAKFQASAHAPKGVKKIQAQDAREAGDEKRRRQRVMDRTYYEAKGIVARASVDERAQGRGGPWQDVKMAETREELQEVMRRWVEGIKDDHDRVVEGAKARIRAEVEGRKAKALAQRKALASALEEEGITKNTLVPIAGEAGQQFLDRVRNRVAGTSKVLQDGTHNSAYDKYIARDAEAGNLAVDESGQIQSKTEVNPEMLKMMMRPPDQETESLQEKIRSRRPTATFRDDGEESS